MMNVAGQRVKITLLAKRIKSPYLAIKFLRYFPASSFLILSHTRTCHVQSKECIRSNGKIIPLSSKKKRGGKFASVSKWPGDCASSQHNQVPRGAAWAGYRCRALAAVLQTARLREWQRTGRGECGHRAGSWASRRRWRGGE
jgi:hypothetical protein